MFWKEGVIERVKVKSGEGGLVVRRGKRWWWHRSWSRTKSWLVVAALPAYPIHHNSHAPATTRLWLRVWPAQRTTTVPSKDSQFPCSPDLHHRGDMCGSPLQFSLDFQCLTCDIGLVVGPEPPRFTWRRLRDGRPACTRYSLMLSLHSRKRSLLGLLIFGNGIQLALTSHSFV